MSILLRRKTEIFDDKQLFLEKSEIKNKKRRTQKKISDENAVVATISQYFHLEYHDFFVKWDVHCDFVWIEPKKISLFAGYEISTLAQEDFLR